MDAQFRTSMKYALLFGLVPLAVLMLLWFVIDWYFGGSIVAHQRNVDTAVWYEGWLNGLLVGPTFLVSLFNDDYGIYRANNSGGWYNFWFLVGAGVFFGSSSRASRG